MSCLLTEGFTEKIHAVKWGQRFVIGLSILSVLALLFFISKIILAEGLSAVLGALMGSVFLAVFFSSLWKMFDSEWDAVKVADEELTDEIDPEIIQLESQLDEERRRRLVAEEELEETKRSLREVRLATLSSAEGLNLDEVVRKYDVVIVEKGLNNPFQLSSELVQIAKDVTAEAEDDITRAKLLFFWMWKNIKYDFAKLKAMNEDLSDDYRDSLEVLEYQAGVCGEQTILYVAMARTVGLTANYVSVTVDDQGTPVSHACAAVSTPGRVILVDPAYRAFDIQHERYEILNDVEAAYLFKVWDKKDQ